MTLEEQVAKLEKEGWNRVVVLHKRVPPKEYHPEPMDYYAFVLPNGEVREVESNSWGARTTGGHQPGRTHDC